MRRPFQALALAVLLALGGPAAAQQASDPDFHPQVAHPAFAGNGPRVLIDQGHDNFHTASGRYAPFAELLRRDGFKVEPNPGAITPEALKGARVLVIANAGVKAGPDPSAFTAAEIEALHRWVEEGGSLLLIADHAPFGSAAGKLAERFGVVMGKGWVYDRNRKALSTQLVFAKADGRLGDHAITRGRNAAEAVKVVRAFTGQSLTVPAGAVNLMVLTREAREAPDTDALNAAAAGKAEAPAAKGTSQGLAMTVGKGRLVVVGEAAMFSAQVARLGDPPRTIKAGMNVPGYDNAQFALNILHWLAGVLN
jgi:hypothetical protein